MTPVQGSSSSSAASAAPAPWPTPGCSRWRLTRRTPSPPPPASSRSPWPGPAPAATGSPPLTGYQIFRGTSPGGESSTALASVTGTTYSDTTVTPGVAYFYTVKAVSPLASSDASNEASATPLPLPPGPPTALTATPGIAQIALAWTAPTIAGNPALTGYQIFRGTTPGGESSTALASVTGTTYTDTTGTPGVAYCYTVKAVSPLASSVASNEATATPLPLPPGPPTALTATPGIAQIALAWTAPTIAGNPALTGYQIFRGTTPGGESSTALTSVTGTTYTDTTTTPGVAYYYTVKAVSPLAYLRRLQRSHRHPAAAPTGRPHRPHRHPRHRPDRPGLDRAQYRREPRLHRLPDLPWHHPRR